MDLSIFCYVLKYNQCSSVSLVVLENKQFHYSKCVVVSSNLTQLSLDYLSGIFELFTEGLMSQKTEYKHIASF